MISTRNDRLLKKAISKTLRVSPIKRDKRLSRSRKAVGNRQVVLWELSMEEIKIR